MMWVTALYTLGSPSKHKETGTIRYEETNNEHQRCKTAPYYEADFETFAKRQKTLDMKNSNYAV